MQDKARCPWKIQLLMNDIKKLLAHFEVVSSCHVYREANRAADYVAAIGHQISGYVNIDPNVDANFSYFISLDKLGYNLERRLS